MKKTQEQKVLKYLETHRGITQAQAIDKLGIYRLSARIYRLREAGYQIITNRKDVTNRFGETCHIAEYRLVK